MPWLYSQTDAWTAMAQGNFQQASQLWVQLLATTQDAETACNYQLAYATVLIARGQFNEARALLEEMYDITEASICLHLLGQAAWQEQKQDAAKAHFLAEQIRLKPSEHLALSLNSHALAALAFEQHKIALAFHYTRHSLEYAQKSGNGLAEACVYRLYGTIRLALKDEEKALHCHESAEAALALTDISNWSELDLRLVQLLMTPPVYALDTVNTRQLFVTSTQQKSISIKTLENRLLDQTQLEQTPSLADS